MRRRKISQRKIGRQSDHVALGGFIIVAGNPMAGQNVGNGSTSVKGGIERRSYYLVGLIIFFSKGETDLEISSPFSVSLSSVDIILQAVGGDAEVGGCCGIIILGGGVNEVCGSVEGKDCPTTSAVVRALIMKRRTSDGGID
ncbi:hypothetical protein Tco_1310315 [Tanacetum coccineum]